MIFLQTHQNNTLLETPKLLVMEVDFDFIFESRLYKSYKTKDSNLSHEDLVNIENSEVYQSYLQLNSLYSEIGDFVANISDCYNSRPLIKIDGFCEFDVIVHQKYDNTRMLISSDFATKEKLGIWNDSLFSTINKSDNYNIRYSGDDIIDSGWQKDNRWDENQGSIFSPENSQKYPELYKQALEIITQKG
jgi:hypothetical protein